MICDVDDEVLNFPYYRLEVAEFRGALEEDFEVVESTGEWFVCRACGELVANDKWNALVDRAIVSREPYSSDHTRTKAIASITALYSMVREHLIRVEVVSE